MRKESIDCYFSAVAKLCQAKHNRYASRFSVVKAITDKICFEL
jgi:hypothetical protein